MTAPDTDDTVAAPHFEDELWLALAEHHERRRTAVPRPAPAHELAQRRRGRRLILTGVGSVAAAAALVVALSLRDDPAPGSGPAPAPDEPAAIPVDLAARVIAATEEAQATMIVHSTLDYGDAGVGGASEAWMDEISGSVRVVTTGEDGELVWDSHPLTVPTDQPSDHRARTVDFCFQEWAEVPAAIDLPPGSSSTDWVQLGLTTGTLVEDGTEVIDGRELIRLAGRDPEGLLDHGFTVEVEEGRPIDPDAVPDDEPLADEDVISHGDETVWVDPETYRPVRAFNDDNGEVQTFGYLERTPENRALLSPPVPDGFTQVPVLRPFEERQTAGCTM